MTAPQSLGERGTPLAFAGLQDARLHLNCAIVRNRDTLLERQRSGGLMERPAATDKHGERFTHGKCPRRRRDSRSQHPGTARRGARGSRASAIGALPPESPKSDRVT